jgi:hypothetical protein
MQTGHHYICDNAPVEPFPVLLRLRLIVAIDGKCCIAVDLECGGEYNISYRFKGLYNAYKSKGVKDGFQILLGTF